MQQHLANVCERFAFSLVTRHLIAWYFLVRGGSISVEASGHRRHCKQLCGAMEIPCRVKFTCSGKAMLNRLIDPLTKKV